MNTAIAFICTNYNKYSIAALAGALESYPFSYSLASPESADSEHSIYFIDIRSGAIAMEQQFQDLINGHDNLLICFSFTTINLVKVNSLLKDIRSWASRTTSAPKPSSNVWFLAGGPHPSGDPLGTLKLGFDIAVIGEAEETFPIIVSSLSKRKNGEHDNKSWREIKGIAYFDGDKFIKTGRRPSIDLNKFAPFSHKNGRLSPIEISRGCPHACRFCQTSFLFGARMRHRSIDEIISCLELSKECGTKDFRFVSPNALAYGSEDGKSVDLATIEELLKRASGITGKEHLFFGSFPSEVRPEAVSQEALDLITTYTGTKMLVVGAQSGSQRMLDLLHREHTTDDVDRAVRIILKNGLIASVDFIFGLPGETDADHRLSIDKMDELAGMGARIHSHAFIPLPGTPLADSNVGIINEDTTRHLSRLANRGLQFGEWQKQQKLARESLEFRTH